jgi:phenylalanine-4-hydroxylase
MGIPTDWEEDQAMSAGKTDHELRGDYSRMREDYTIEQDWAGYAEQDHETWRTLYQRQLDLIEHYACQEYIDAVHGIAMADGIPDFERASDWLEARTGWRIVAVPGLIPDNAFFDHLANRRFPVTDWIRKPEELDYLVEPDVFHDFFGHVPMLATPAFADFMAKYGEVGRAAIEDDTVANLARLYWYTAEFGLVRQAGDLKIYGAGILSSSTETVYAIDSNQPNRIGFDAERIMRTDYRLDDLQATYFVVESFDELFAGLDGDIRGRLKAAQQRTVLPAEAVLDSDRVYHHGRAMMKAAAE